MHDPGQRVAEDAGLSRLLCRHSALWRTVSWRVSSSAIGREVRTSQRLFPIT